jgi:Ca2+-binding EF-hand superfamily protein
MIGDDPAVTQYMKKFAAEDTEQTGEINLSAFSQLAKYVLSGDEDDELLELYFQGIDINGNGTVSRDDFREFVVAALRDNKQFFIKLLFRAFDTNRSRSLSINSIKQIGQYSQSPRTNAEVKQAIVTHTGKEDGKLTFPQVIQLLTGETIQDDIDPYDGKLKSGCCLLL